MKRLQAPVGRCYKKSDLNDYSMKSSIWQWKVIVGF
jgi:hypothetical protein